MSLDVEKQKERFDVFRKERMPVLHELAKNLEFPNPHEILLNPKEFLSPLSAWLSEQEISEDAKNWITVRIGYFLGELFIQKYDGCWLVCELVCLKHYSHYVVGEFSAISNPNALFSPMESAFELASQPIGRSLIAKVSEIEGVLHGM